MNSDESAIKVVVVQPAKDGRLVHVRDTLNSAVESVQDVNATIHRVSAALCGNRELLNDELARQLRTKQYVSVKQIIGR